MFYIVSNYVLSWNRRMKTLFVTSYEQKPAWEFARNRQERYFCKRTKAKDTQWMIAENGAVQTQSF